MSAKLQATFRTVFGEIGAAQGQVVATLAEVEVFVGDLVKANAELLATLKSLQDWGEKYGGLGEWPKAEIRAAIKRAEGES